MRCANFQGPVIPPGTSQRKYLIERSTFNLTITDIELSDGGNYTCQLSLVDPASSNGQTKQFANDVLVRTITVDGELH